MWVALGLLGDAVPLEEAGFNPAGFEDASAWVLAITLADCESAGERVRELDRLAEGDVRQLTDMALARMEQRMFVWVVG